MKSQPQAILLTYCSQETLIHMQLLVATTSIAALSVVNQVIFLTAGTLLPCWATSFLDDSSPPTAPPQPTPLVTTAGMGKMTAHTHHSTPLQKVCPLLSCFFSLP